MNGLQVHLLGKFRIQRAGQPLKELNAAKAQELFCYLLLYPHRSHHRESLANILWEDAAGSQSKQYLRRALWQLQSALADATAPAETEIICVDGDWIQLNPQARLWVDALQFAEYCQAGQEIPGHQLETQTAVRLQEAVQLYQGDLLEGWYQEWCLFERERYTQLFLATLDRLMQYCEKCGAYETGIGYGRRALWYDRAREHTHQQLMRLYFYSGNRTGALQQYEQCVAVLAEELGVKPTQTTETLYDQICDAHVDLEQNPELGHGNGRFLPSHNFHDDLQHLRGLLLTVQEQVGRQLEAVESALRHHS